MKRWTNFRNSRNWKKIKKQFKLKLNGNVSKNIMFIIELHLWYGWLDWAKNGESAGTIGLSKRIEAIEVKLVKKEEEKNAARTTNRPCVELKLEYSTHIQITSMAKYDGEISGTTGEIKKIRSNQN